VYSPELADIQSRYVASRAELDARTRDLRRTERLVEIGSASKQELERIHSEQTAAGTMAESLRSQMMLLGVTLPQIEKLGSSQQITATVSIPSPMDGVITERTANVGLNVDAATKLFTVVDLASVWLVGNVYERDFGRVREGSVVKVATSAYPDLQLEGKVSYIDPSVNPETRTAQLRVEVPNRGHQLRFGMYVEMIVDELSAERVLVPRAAIQMIGERAVVYLSDPAVAGRFIEREVQLGAATDNQVEIVSGVQAGDPIVVTGSFALRAERERRGLGTPSPARAREGAHQPAQSGAAQNVRITVSEKGFEPARVPLRAGAPMRLTFVRTTDATCATEIAIPALKIKRELPLNQPVAIDFTPEKPGEIAFACGMDMFTGTLVVQ
jgi:RND family efflux transporter MFP subunit